MSRGRSLVRLARRALGLTAFCAFAATAVLAADDNKVIFPAGNATSTTTSAASAGGGFGNATLVLGLILAAVGGWFVWRGRNAAPLGRDLRQLSLSETRSLGNRQYLVVASYEDKKFLLGVCPGRIDLIAPLHDSAPAEKPRT